ATLTYPNSAGTDVTVDYVQESGMHAKSINSLGIKAMEAEGPPPGFKIFKLAPWGAPGESTIISDFLRGGTATIKVYKDGVLEDSRTVTITTVDLTKAVIEFLVPKKDIFDASSAFITNFEAGTNPTLSWTFGSTDDTTVSFGDLNAAYAIEIRTVGDDGRPDFGPEATVYATWNSHEFPPAVQDETTSLTLTATLAAGTTYTIMGAVVGIDDDGWPIVSGPWRSTLFKVVEDITTTGTTTVAVTGIVTSPATVTGTIKVGLVRMMMDTDFSSATITPLYVTAPVATAYSMIIDLEDLEAAGMGGYDTLAWDDIDGDGKIDGPAERPFFPVKHLEYHGGALNAMDRHFTFLGPVNSSENNSGYNVDMTTDFWGD
ncbi:MAG: hypothetical protein KJ811_01440, partial [Candidatus Margulisbacteria bacterium]|nr:hypothetical protein [Candidatus Margulisiibacteriota bacterium]